MNEQSPRLPLHLTLACKESAITVYLQPNQDLYERLADCNIADFAPASEEEGRVYTTLQSAVALAPERVLSSLWRMLGIEERHAQKQGLIAEAGKEVLAEEHLAALSYFHRRPNSALVLQSNLVLVPPSWQEDLEAREEKIQSLAKGRVKWLHFKPLSHTTPQAWPVAAAEVGKWLDAYPGQLPALRALASPFYHQSTLEALPTPGLTPRSRL